MPPEAAGRDLLDDERETPQDIQAFARCWNDGAFFAAHETLEPRWVRVRDRGLQGLIQLAAAFHHIQRGNLRGARTMLERAIPRLTDPQNAPCALPQITLAQFGSAIKAKLDDLAARQGELDGKIREGLIASRPRL